MGLGGFIGAIIRYVISLYSKTILGGAFPFGTLIVNVTGGLLIGFLIKFDIKDNLKLLIITGLLGALTTFSTFSYETIHLIEINKLFFAISNVVFNLSLCLIAVYIGQKIYSIL